MAIRWSGWLAVLPLSMACADVLGLHRASLDPETTDSLVQPNVGVDASSEQNAPPDAPVEGSDAGSDPSPARGDGGLNDGAPHHAAPQDGTQTDAAQVDSDGGSGRALPVPTASSNDPASPSAVPSPSTVIDAVIPSCEQYCDAVMDACVTNEDERHAVYDSKYSCLKHCAQFPPGEPGDLSGNSLACRHAHALVALSFPGERQFECPAAGPGGDGVCGTNCEGYCSLMDGLCPETFDGDCAAVCSAVPDLGGYDVSQIEGNSLQCRFYHLGAATVSPQFHCAHAAGEQPCADE